MYQPLRDSADVWATGGIKPNREYEGCNRGRIWRMKTVSGSNAKDYCQPLEEGYVLYRELRGSAAALFARVNYTVVGWCHPPVMLKPCCFNPVVRPEEGEWVDDEAAVDALSRLVFVSSLTYSGNG